VLAFGRFAGRVAAALGDAVRLWVILNEPLVFLLAGYLDAQIPPGMADTRTLNRVFDHLLAAHCAAAGEIRSHNARAAFSVAHNMMGFAPQRESNPLDGLLAKAAHTMYNRGMLEAFGTGRWNFLLPPTTSIRGQRDRLPRGSTRSASTSIRACAELPGTQARHRRLRLSRPHRPRPHRQRLEIARILGELIDEASLIERPAHHRNGLADATDRFRPTSACTTTRSPKRKRAASPSTLLPLVARQLRMARQVRAAVPGLYAVDRRACLGRRDLLWTFFASWGAHTCHPEPRRRRRTANCAFPASRRRSFAVFAAQCLQR
jgi:hypothetical protein